MKLQTSNKDMAGFIDKSRLRRLLEVDTSHLKSESVTGDEQERLLLTHLKSIGASKDILNEVTRASKRKANERGSLEILDINTLMSLEEFQEQHKNKFRNQKERKEHEKAIRDVKNASLCQRCRSLRF